MLMSRRKNSASVSADVHKMPSFQEKNYEAGRNIRKRKLPPETKQSSEPDSDLKQMLENIWQGI